MGTTVYDKEKAIRSYEKKKSDLVEAFLKLTHRNNQPIRLYKDTSNLFRTRKPSEKHLDVRHFNQVIDVDPIKQVAEIEGMATYEAIVKETLAYHLIPAVVPELKSITI